MRILISNRQKIGRPNTPRIRRLILFFMTRPRKHHSPRRWAELSLVLTDDAGISRINRLYLDREGATDVISFAWPAGPGGGGYCGELFVNVQRALEAGRGNVEREMALYIAHACDHACGAGDRTGAGRRQMRARELAWLRTAAQQNLLNGIFFPGGTREKYVFTAARDT